jgi:Ca2+-binding EF-hand superfamily protein
MAGLVDEEKAKDVWAIFDTDKDGLITKQEFIAAIRVLGRRYTIDQMERVTRGLPPQVDYETFVGILQDPYDGPTIEDLRNALRAFDGKGNGEITFTQMESLLTTMGDKLNEEDCRVVMEGLPSNGTGKASTIDQLMSYFNPPVPSMKPNIPDLLRDLMKEELQKQSIACGAELHTTTSGSGASAEEVNTEILENEVFR